MSEHWRFPSMYVSPIDLGLESWPKKQMRHRGTPLVRGSIWTGPTALNLLQLFSCRREAGRFVFLLRPLTFHTRLKHDDGTFVTRAWSGKIWRVSKKGFELKAWRPATQFEIADMIILLGRRTYEAQQSSD